MGMLIEKELLEVPRKDWFPEKGRKNGELGALGCAQPQPSLLMWVGMSQLPFPVGYLNLPQEANLQLAPATTVETTEEAVKSVFRAELEGIRSVKACLFRRIGEGDKWLIVVVASTRRSREPVRERVAGRMWDIEESLPESDIEFVVYSKKELDWPSCKGRLLANYTEVF